MELKDSETLKNLMRAFAGESQARNRYTFAAGICRQQKLQVLEAVFLFTAGQEKEHAEIFYNHMKAAAGTTVHIDGGYPVDLTNDAAQLLRYAHHNELEEAETVYPAFAATAREEGFDHIAYLFEHVGAIEKEHEERYRKLAESIKNGTVFARQTEQVWICTNCGHIHVGTHAPEKCPVCDHPQGYFVLRAQNY